MALDRRLPGIYIDVEDRSLALETIDSGRVGYVVILSDRGEHNKVVQLNSRADLYDKYGKPDFLKTGHGHYLAEKFLSYSSRLFVVRPALVDSDDDENSMSISNANITIDPSATTDIAGSFEVEKDSKIMICDSTSILKLKINDWIKIEDSIFQIVNINKLNITLNSNYLGVTPELPLTSITKITEIPVSGSFTFTKNSNIITNNSTSILNLNNGECIIYDDIIFQVSDINTTDSENVKIILDSKYLGNTTVIPVTSINKIKYASSESQLNIRNIESLDTQDSKVAWYFYAIGAGSYYNPIYIQGVRNTELEKMYTDDLGIPLYPYLFMDLTIYIKNNDGSKTILDGPFSVSLIDRLPGGQIISDIFSGEQLYLPVVFNKRSNKIKCIEGKGVDHLMTVGSGITYPYTLDVNFRKLVQSTFINKIQLANGENGSLYSSNGLLNFNAEYQDLVAQAYNGSLVSTDGSIELLNQSIYPLYLLDYVLCGGYTIPINDAARELVDARQDCLLLTDTGPMVRSVDDDIAIRKMDILNPDAPNMNWNTFNAAIYPTYREMYDINTGKRFYMTPVYHATDRHLYVDSNYWLSEPVAGIEKGAISDSIKLAYNANLTKLGDLVDGEMNPVIVEPDGTYILTQFSTWKRLSIMKRLHAVKFIHYIKKEIPKLLKDILQRKATPYWINQCNLRINGFMNQFLSSSTNDKYSTLTNYSAVISFDDVRSEINTVLSVSFIRTIEKINITILTL